MSIKHKKEREPSIKTARNSRRAVHKYYPIDETHSFSVSAGRCSKCNKITDAFCDKCSKWCCGNHLHKKNDLEFCEKCLKSNSP